MNPSGEQPLKAAAEDLHYPMATGLNKGLKVNKNESKPSHSHCCCHHCSRHHLTKHPKCVQGMT